MIYPTRRAIIFVGLSVFLALAGLALAGPFWVLGLTWLVIALILLAVDGWNIPSAQSLSVKLSHPGLLYIGDIDPLRVTISCVKQQRLDVDVKIDVGKCLVPLDMARIGIYGGQADGIFELRPIWRGTGAIRAIWLRWSGPFGLMRCRKISNPDVEIPIVANSRAVRAAAIAFYARDARYGQKQQRHKGEGTEFNALKDYAKGHDARTIDWKHSARHGKLLVKEFETERNHNIIFAIDTGQLMREPLDGLSRLDRAINAALVSSYISIRHGDKVGLFGFDEKVRVNIKPLSGERGFLSLQKASGRLGYTSKETNYTLGLSKLAAGLNRRSMIILMTEFVDTTTAELMLEAVGRLTKRHFVLFTTFKDRNVDALLDQSPETFNDVTRAVVAADFNKERQLVLARLRHMGVDLLDCAPEDFSTELVNRYLLIKDRGLI